jgi:branched-chain amino acid transport system permease protein
MAFLGGLGTVSGPVLGALILEPTQLYFTQQVTSGYVYLILYGALFLVVILVLPRGIIPTVGELVTNWRSRRAGRPQPPVPGQPAPSVTARGPA